MFIKAYPACRVKNRRPSSGHRKNNLMTYYPDFFDAAPVITLHDPLAQFLGAVDGGIMEYRYLDAVRLTGPSSPP